MNRIRITFTLAAAALVWLAGAQLDAEKIEIKADADPTFPFAAAKTWAWHPDGGGDVRLALSQDQDPKRVAARVDPIIVPALEKALQARGLTKAADKPDLFVHYYMLAILNQQAQYMGQFIAPVPQWGLPPFSAQTSALEIYPVGTLIVDLTSPERKSIVWRGSAQRKIDWEKPDAERKKVLEKAINDLMQKFPPPPPKKK